MKARWHGGTVAAGWMALLLGSATTACSKKEGAARAPAGKSPELATVVTASWGSGPGQLGAVVPEEGSPEAAKSFVVDADGRVHVLDQVNARIQSFAEGKAAGSLALPARPFEDIELDAGGFLLLDLYETPAVVGLGVDGTVSGELPLPAEEIPEPGLVTALRKTDNGIWVELEDQFLVQVADATGSPVETDVVPGQLTLGPQVFRATVDGTTRVDIHRQAMADGAPERFATLSFDHDVREPSLLAATSDQRLLVVVLLEHEQSDPETAPAREHVLVQLSASGSELGRLALPAGSGAHETFRSVRQGADGNVYVMRTSDTGVEIVKVTP